jgi:hypothetical protein
MEKIGVFIRSKIPVLVSGDNSSDETMLLTSSKSKSKSRGSSGNTILTRNYMSTVLSKPGKIRANAAASAAEAEYDEDELVSISNENNTMYNATASATTVDAVSQDYSDSDLFSLHDKSRANRINEWQAAWNVTNAIQVILFRFD